MQLDVVTLFPEWFEWFRSQRHVANAIAAGHELRALNPREHSPLSGVWSRGLRQRSSWPTASALRTWRWVRNQSNHSGNSVTTSSCI